jgi:hypothetical protein
MMPVTPELIVLSIILSIVVTVRVDRRPLLWACTVPVAVTLVAAGYAIITSPEPDLRSFIIRVSFFWSIIATVPGAIAGLLIRRWRAGL